MIKRKFNLMPLMVELCEQWVFVRTVLLSLYGFHRFNANNWHLKSCKKTV